MEIICNHCGTTIIFFDYQCQVTCPSCNTHLKIEEEKNRIAATIIKERNFDNTIFEQRHLPSDLQNFSDLFDLMRLEAEYDEAMDANFANSITVGKKMRPILLRGLYRVAFGGLFIRWIMVTVANKGSGGGLLGEVAYSPLGVFFFLYGLFLLKIGITETVKWFRFWKFEKEYLKDKTIIIERLHFSILKLPNILKRIFTDFEDNEKFDNALN